MLLEFILLLALYSDIPLELVDGLYHVSLLHLAGLHELLESLLILGHLQQYMFLLQIILFSYLFLLLHLLHSFLCLSAEIDYLLSQSVNSCLQLCIFCFQLWEDFWVVHFHLFSWDLRQWFSAHFQDYFLSAFHSSCLYDIADHNSILANADPIAICVVFNDIIEEGLKVEEDGECLGRYIVDIVKLFEAIFFDIVGSVDG